MNNENRLYRRMALKDADPRPDDKLWKGAYMLVVLKLHRIAKSGPDEGVK